MLVRRFNSSIWLLQILEIFLTVPCNPISNIFTLYASRFLFQSEYWCICSDKIVVKDSFPNLMMDLIQIQQSSQLKLLVFSPRPNCLLRSLGKICKLSYSRREERQQFTESILAFLDIYIHDRIRWEIHEHSEQCKKLSSAFTYDLKTWTWIKKGQHFWSWNVGRQQ